MTTNSRTIDSDDTWYTDIIIDQFSELQENFRRIATIASSKKHCGSRIKGL
jgi:hypothetical protein